MFTHAYGSVFPVLCIYCGPAFTRRTNSCCVVRLSHAHTHRFTSTTVTTRTPIDTGIPQVIIYYRDLCTTPFGLSSCWEDIRSKDTVFVPKSNHLVRATLPWRWWPTTGICTPHARTLAHGKRPTCMVLSCTGKCIYTIWRGRLVGN